MKSSIFLLIRKFLVVCFDDFEITKLEMPERTSGMKARRESPTSSVDEPEASSMRTENVLRISDEKSVCRRIKDTETGQKNSSTTRKREFII